MRRTFLTVVLTIIVIGAIFIGLMYRGVYNVGASNHDNAVVNWYLHTGAKQAIVFHAKDIAPPPLTDPDMIRRGGAEYQEMCASCHAAPGVEPGEISKGLWPPPPKLRDGVANWTPGQLFWTVKNGIKFSAMPASGPTHSDDQIWDLVAFLERQPRLSSEDYDAILKSADEHGEEHSH